MVNRDRFLPEGLAKFYELKIQEANATIQANASAAQEFVANNGGTPAAAAEAVRNGTFVGSPEAYRIYYNTSLDLPQLTAMHKGLTVSGPTNEEFMEVALEDFRARTAERMNVQEEGKPDRVEVVSRAEVILGVRNPIKAFTYRGKADLAEVYLTEKKGDQAGLFSGKSAIEKIEDFKLENIDVLINNLAVVEYQRELRTVEIPAENSRAAQMSTVRALDNARTAATLTKNWGTFASQYFPFLQGRDPAKVAEIIGEGSTVYEAIGAGQKELTTTFESLVSKKGVVGTEHLTGNVQPGFEELYNSLFGMNNLRERRPDAVHPYGALSGLLVNEAMTQIQTSPDGKVSKEWIDSATSSVFPQTFVMEAIEHAQENQKFLNEFLRVREVTPEHGIVVTDAATRLAQVKTEHPKVVQNTGIFLDAVSKVIVPLIDPDKKLSSTERLVMTQIVAREMTITAPAGSALEAINVQLVNNLARSTEQLRIDGKLPDLGKLNDLALSAMVVQEKGADGRVHTVPNEAILEQIYTTINATQDALPPERADEKFSMPLYRPGEETPINAVPDEANAYTEERDGVQYKITPVKYETVTDFTGDNKGVLAYTFGSHFFQAADRSMEEKMGLTTGAKEDAEKQEPGVYGTYGAIVQNHIAQEYAKSEEKRKQIIKDASVPEYDGWKYKLLTKTKFYQEKFAEYYKMYMGSGGPAVFFNGVASSDVHNAVKKYPVQEQVEEVVETQDPDPVPPEPSPYDELGKKLSGSFKALENLHKRLVEKTVQGNGKDANRGLYFRNDEEGINAISFQSASVRRMNSRVANTVLSSIQKAIEENPDRDPAEVVAELKNATRTIMVAGKEKEIPVIPNGISVSEDGQTVRFFGVSYTREVNEETNQATVYAHYNPEGEKVPQSTMITIMTHDQAEVRGIAAEYMNANKDVIEGRERAGQAPLIPDETAALNAFVQQDPTTGEYGLASGIDALKRGPSGYDKGTLDKADTRDISKIEKASDMSTIIEEAVIDDPTA